jgi:Cu/Zn superoxide dismutase
VPAKKNGLSLRRVPKVFPTTISLLVKFGGQVSFWADLLGLPSDARAFHVHVTRIAGPTEDLGTGQIGVGGLAAGGHLGPGEHEHATGADATDGRRRRAAKEHAPICDLLGADHSEGGGNDGGRRLDPLTSLDVVRGHWITIHAVPQAQDGGGARIACAVVAEA